MQDQSQTVAVAQSDEMPTLIITKNMLDADNSYVGEPDVTEWVGHIEIAASLGRVR